MQLTDTLSGVEPPIQAVGVENSTYLQVRPDSKITVWTKKNGAWSIQGNIPSSGGTPSGSDTQIQFNDGGSFGGDGALTWQKTTQQLLVASTDPNGSSALNIQKSGSTVNPQAAASITAFPAGNLGSDVVGALYVSAEYDGASTVHHDFTSLMVDTGLFASGSIDSMSAIKLDGNYTGGGGSVGTNYGLDIRSQSGIGTTKNAAINIADQGTGANDYAIFVAGGKSVIVFPDADPHVAGAPYWVAGALVKSAG